MKKTETRIVCDLCAGPRSSADIRCERHKLDLCISHMRAHFDRRKCRLVPVDREPTASEQLSEKINANLGNSARPRRHAAAKLEINSKPKAASTPAHYAFQPGFARIQSYESGDPGKRQRRAHPKIDFENAWLTIVSRSRGLVCEV